MQTPIVPPVSKEVITSPWGQQVSSQLNGIQHKRVPVASVATMTTADVQVTWDRPFADANYTVVAMIVNDTNNTQYITLVHPAGRGPQTPTGILIAVRNTHSSAVGPFKVHVIAVHD